MNSYSKRSNAYRTGAYRTSAYRTAFSLLMIVSVLLGTVVSPMAALAAPPSLDASIQPQAASVNNAEAASAPVAERALDKPLESSLDAPVVVPAELPGQPDPVVLGSNTITLTKSVVGSTESNFSVNITGPSYPSGAVMPIVSGTQVITGLASGMYTITEVSPGAGWTTTYTATTGYSTGSSAVVTLTNLITVAATAVGQITGVVYNDYNSNGMRETSSTIIDSGVQSVTVTAYDRKGAIAGTATSYASGLYTLTTTASGLTGPYRLEFTNLPAGYEPSRVYTGTQNGTSTQFVSAPTSNVNFGIVVPNDYAQDNPMLVIPMHTNGSGVGNTLPGLVAFSYNGSDAMTTVLQESQIGATWGEGYQRSPGRLFVSSFMRRQVGFKDGPGYVYVLDRNGNILSLASSFDLQGIVPANGGPAIDLGSVCRRDNSDGDPNNNCLPLGGVAADYTLPSDYTQPSVDLDAYAKVGKMSYGDIEVSEDGKTLWLTNLYQNALISVDISGSAVPGSVKQYPLSGLSGVPACGDFNNNGSVTPTGDLHPFALKFANGNGYLGVTCDAYNSRDNGDLRAFVLSFDPANPDAGFAPVITVPLDYLLHNASEGKPHWLPWSSTWAQSLNNPDGDSVIAPEPLLSDIEFSEDGSIIVGLMDRHALQQFSNNHHAISQDSSVAPIYEVGDILKFCNVTGGYVMEGMAASCPVLAKGTSIAGQLTSDGISGNGEFFMEVRADLYHEAFMGALALLPGSTNVVGTLVDPGGNNEDYNSGGTAWWSTTVPGANTRTYRVYPPVYTGRSTPGYADKGNGLGDIELLIDPAPIEIGNRVWNDLNNDGIQDAGEPALSGVVVSLQTPQGTIQTTTDINGQYIFTREATSGAYSTTLRSNMQYTITINPSQPALTGYSLTQANTQAISGSTSSNDPILDTRDSDAYMVSGLATIHYTTGGPGQNNHGLDFGFSKPVTGQVDILNTAPLQQTYDLALRKRVVNQTANVDGSRVVTYTIEVFNQGDASASNIELVDYLPVHSALGTPTNGWTVAGTTLTSTVPGPIAPDASETVTLVLNLSAASSGRWVTNTAEIAADDGDDIDSTPDIINDDKRVDDVINDNPTTGSDEDDHDIAVAPPICPAATIWNGGVYNDSQGAFVTNVEGLDWSSAGSGVFEGIGPIGTSVPVGTQFTLRYQAGLVGWTDPNGSALPESNDLAQGVFEYTLIAEVSMIVLSEINIPGIGLQILTLATQPGGQYYIYHDANPNYGVPSGVGFDDGTLVASGYVNAGQIASFTYNGGGNSATGSFSFISPVSYANPTYLDSTDKLAEFRLEGTLNYPALDSTTTTFFAGRAGEGNLDDYTVTGNDILLKVDTSSKLYECITDAQFGDRVFLEEDGDGLASTGVITAVAGMVITATNGTEIYTTTTGADGYYSFTVPADTYTVTYGDVPAVYGAVVPSTVVSGTSESGNAGSYQQSGNPDANHGQNTVVIVAVGEANWHVDFAFYPPAVVLPVQFGDRVWIETAGDGTIGSGETITAVNGMEIYATDGTNFYTTTTNSQGYYSFTLPAGSYTVSYGSVPPVYGTVLPSTVVSGTSESGDVGSYQEAGNPDVNHGQNTVVTLAAGEANWHVDFAFYPPAVLPVQFGDRVWIESDGDGLASSGTITPVSGMEIYATDGTNYYTATTDSQGYYSFNVPAGSYTVSYSSVPGSYGSVLPSTVVSGTSESGNTGTYQESGNPDANHGQNTTVTLAAGEANWHVDFAFYPTPPAMLATFGNFVWIELDGDGIAGNGVITPVVGLVITATDGTNVYTETTDSTGYFSFTVPAGTYTVTYGTPPAGTVPSNTPNSGVISSGSPGTDQQSSPNGVVITLAAGESIPTVDFAFTQAPEPSLRIDKTASTTTVRSGSLVTYTLTLTNDGPGEGSNVVVHDLLPAGLNYLTYTASSGVYVVATGDWTIPVVPVGSETLTITVQVK